MIPMATMVPKDDNNTNVSDGAGGALELSNEIMVINFFHKVVDLCQYTDQYK